MTTTDKSAAAGKATDETPPEPPDAGQSAAEELPPVEEANDKAPRRRPLSGRRKRSDAGKPRGSSSRRSTTGTSTPRAAGGSAVMTRKLAGFVNTIGAVVSMIEPYDGRILIENAQPLANGWAKVADRHPRVRQAIDGMEAGGVYGAAIAATLAVAVPILAHHRLLPPLVLAAMGIEPLPITVHEQAPPAPAPPPPAQPRADRPAPPRPVSGAPAGTPIDGRPLTAVPPMPAGGGAPSGAPLAS